MNVQTKRNPAAVVCDLLLAVGYAEHPDHEPGEGRTRFKIPDTDRYATVGMRTTTFYRPGAFGVSEFVNVPTCDLDAVAAALRESTEGWRGYEKRV